MNTTCMRDAACDGGKHRGGMETVLGESSRKRRSVHKLQWHYLRFAWVFTSLVAQRVRRLPTMREIQVQSLGREEPLEKEMAPHSSTLAWKIPWMEERGGLQSMGSRRVGHDWGLHFHFLLLCIGEGNGNPLQCSCLENPMDGGAWWATIHGVAKSRTQLSKLTSLHFVVWQKQIQNCEEIILQF